MILLSTVGVAIIAGAFGVWQTVIAKDDDRTSEVAQPQEEEPSSDGGAGEEIDSGVDSSQEDSETIEFLRLTVEPDSGKRGDTITLTGSGFAPHETVRCVYVYDTSYKGNHADLKDVIADEHGRFSVDVIIPIDLTSYAEGRRMQATGLLSEKVADAVFHLLEY
ncbi:hypothetical protein [Streptomyces ginkgonis]|uniref:hypothetical protein n=1 Tax=Streptomyces ginkgonis TaxID=1812259 RepID=UPI002176C985|nr:hypothetical protein [Streptomyces ginkgonis]